MRRRPTTDPQTWHDRHDRHDRHTATPPTSETATHTSTSGADTAPSPGLSAATAERAALRFLALARADPALFFDTIVAFIEQGGDEHHRKQANFLATMWLLWYRDLSVNERLAVARGVPLPPLRGHRGHLYALR